MLTLAGCLGTGRLRQTDYLLDRQNFRGNRSLTTNELTTLLPQKPNHRFLGIPGFTTRLWFYQLGARSFDRDAVRRELDAKTTEFEQKSQTLSAQPAQLKKLNRQFSRRARRLRRNAEQGNWVMRVLGEPPTYFSEADTKANAEKIRKYLYNKGFFNVRASYSLDTIPERRIRVNYRIDEQSAYYLRRVTFDVADPRVDSIVRRSLGGSLLKPGARYDATKLAAEKVRIEELLRDKGYYGFSRQYIPVADADTTLTASDSTRRPLDLTLRILNPPGQSSHPVYTLSAVTMTVSSPDPGMAQPDSVVNNGIRYLLGERNISTRLLDTKIHLRPGALFSQTDYRETQRQLFLLNQFKFANVNLIADTARREIRTSVAAQLLDRYDYSFEGGLNIGYLAYPGPFANLTFRMRNIFGGMETLEISGRGAIEGQAGLGQDSVYVSSELGLNTSLIFPQILFPGPLRFRFNDFNPRTQLSLGFNLTSRPEFARQTFRTTMNYNWQVSPNRQFSFFVADINVINTRFTTSPIGRAFEQFIRDQTQFARSLYNGYNPSFASNFGLTYTHNTNLIGQNRKASFLRVAVESGGTTLNFLTDTLVRRLTTETGLQFYKYVRGSVDFRYYIPVRQRTTLAFRLNSGIVAGYGPNKDAPYERLFFAGGPNSVRAWQLRRLGPGSAVPQLAFANDPNGQLRPAFRGDTTLQFDYRREQPGAVLLEGSAELRGRLFRLGADINGAVFVDAGNVWTIQNEPNRTGENFRFNSFLSQLAVGTGVGLRIDFSFFVIRIDGAIKVYDPARRYLNAQDQLVDERFILPKFSLRQLTSGSNPLVVQFGIGYPF
ncbi:MAG: BamA/TamA family outer membrane protein [Bacteroidetes bacterium]|nr:BamA/TamA family outer membrane protein [Fibrella sp.]